VARKHGLIFGVMAAIVAITLSSTANATAWAGVKYAFVGYYDIWGISNDDPNWFSGNLNITVTNVTTTKSTVIGDGVVSTGYVSLSPSFLDIRDVTASVSGEGFASVTVIDSYTLEITNNSGYAFSGIGYYIEWAVFNPGGDSVGASVTNPKSERATYLSSIYGDGVGVGESSWGDTSAADCGHNFGDFNIWPGIQCGVRQPDGNSYDSILGPLGIGQSISTTFILTISVKASSVPEPFSASLLGSALAALAINRRKRHLV
jgi:hypothetical protein